MVISRSDAKRRRKEGDGIEDSLQGSPKRTKVHAQRKFAQGSSNLSSPALTPVKDKDKIKSNGTVLSPELIPSKRPKTEDFLTFLCFRGTPILPPQLDFFNVATVQDSQDEEQGSSLGECSSSRTATMTSVNQKPQRSTAMEQASNSGVNKKSERMEGETKRKSTTAVQALRKKYQEQRLAKQRASTLNKLAQKVKGKNMVRTRSSTIHEELRPADLQKLKPKKHIIKRNPGKPIQVTRSMKPLKHMALRRMSARGQRKPGRDLRYRGNRRGGLRSGGQLPPGSEEGLKTEKMQHVRHPITKEKKDKSKPKVFASPLSDFSSDDDQPLVKKTRPLEHSNKQQFARRMVKRIVKASRKLRPQMVTRSHLSQQEKHQQQPVISKISSRPTRKTKEAAALYMEMLGKKLITPECEVDEDSLSIDSFPELPNSRRNEQRENEIKARHSKEKKEIQDQKKDPPNQKKEPQNVKRDIQNHRRDVQNQRKDAQLHKEIPKSVQAVKTKLEKRSSGKEQECGEIKGRTSRIGISKIRQMDQTRDGGARDKVLSDISTVKKIKKQDALKCGDGVNIKKKKQELTKITDEGNLNSTNKKNRQDLQKHEGVGDINPLNKCKKQDVKKMENEGSVNPINKKKRQDEKTEAEVNITPIIKNKKQDVPKIGDEVNINPIIKNKKQDVPDEGNVNSINKKNRQDLQKHEGVGDINPLNKCKKQDVKKKENEGSVNPINKKKRQDENTEDEVNINPVIKNKKQDVPKIGDGVNLNPISKDKKQDMQKPEAVVDVNSVKKIKKQDIHKIVDEYDVEPTNKNKKQDIQKAEEKIDVTAVNKNKKQHMQKDEHVSDVNPTNKNKKQDVLNTEDGVVNPLKKTRKSDVKNIGDEAVIINVFSKKKKQDVQKEGEEDDSISLNKGKKHNLQKGEDDCTVNPTDKKKKQYMQNIEINQKQTVQKMEGKIDDNPSNTSKKQEVKKMNEDEDDGNPTNQSKNQDIQKIEDEKAKEKKMLSKQTRRSVEVKDDTRGKLEGTELKPKKSEFKLKKNSVVRKKSLDSEDEDWEEGKGLSRRSIKVPSKPRRSLRRSSRDAVHFSDSSSTVALDVASVRRTRHASLSPISRQFQKHSKSLDDKFSDSDEEPLGKIALKNSSGCQKAIAKINSQNTKEDKPIKDDRITVKKQSWKETMLKESTHDTRNKMFTKATRATANVSTVEIVNAETKESKCDTTEDTNTKTINSVRPTRDVCDLDKIEEKRQLEKLELESRKELNISNKVKSMGNRKKCEDLILPHNKKEENEKSRLDVEKLKCLSQGNEILDTVLNVSNIVKSVDNGSTVSVTRSRSPGKKTIKEQKHGNETNNMGKETPNDDKNTNQVLENHTKCKANMSKVVVSEESNIQNATTELDGNVISKSSSVPLNVNKSLSSLPQSSSATTKVAKMSSEKNKTNVKNIGSNVITKKLKSDKLIHDSELVSSSSVKKSTLYSSLNQEVSLQRKGGGAARKESKSEVHRRLSKACLQETELELQRRMSLVCLKETEGETQTKLNQPMNKLSDLRTEERLNLPRQDGSDGKSQTLAVITENDVNTQRAAIQKETEGNTNKQSSQEATMKCIEKMEKKQKEKLCTKLSSQVPETQDVKTPKTLISDIESEREESEHKPLIHNSHEEETCSRLTGDIQLEWKVETHSTATSKSAEGKLPNMHSLKPETTPVLIAQMDPEVKVGACLNINESDINTDVELHTNRNSLENRLGGKLQDTPNGGRHTEYEVGVHTTFSSILPTDSTVENANILSMPLSASPRELNTINTRESNLEIQTILGLVSPQESSVGLQEQWNEVAAETCHGLHSHAQSHDQVEQYTEVPRVVPIEGEMKETVNKLNSMPDQTPVLHSCREPGVGDERTLHFESISEAAALMRRQSSTVTLNEAESDDRQLDIVSAGLVNPLSSNESLIRDSKGKGRVNMSTERIEKWLNESCSGSLEHKKDCSLFEGNPCKCGISVEDDICLPELTSDRLVPQRMLDCNDLEAHKLKLAKIGIPQYLSEVTGHQTHQAEKNSEFGLNDYTQKPIQTPTQPINTDHSKEVLPNRSSVVGSNIAKSSLPYETKQTGNLNFVLSSLVQESLTLPVNEAVQRKAQWENTQLYTVKEVGSSPVDLFSLPVDHTLSSVAKVIDSSNIKIRENVDIDREKHGFSECQLSPNLQARGTAHLRQGNVKDVGYNLEELPEKVKTTSVGRLNRLKRVNKVEASYNRPGVKMQQVADRMGEKKSIFQQRRPFPHKVKERKVLTPSANAFSPENESSVYAFETEPESPPISTPFRRRARDSRTSSTTTSKSEEDLAKLGEEEISPPVVVQSLPPPGTMKVVEVERPVTCITVQNIPSCRYLQVSNSRTSTSIAVQVNLDTELCVDTSPPCTPVVDPSTPEPILQRSMECSTQTEVTEEEDDESEGHLFYIPLQQAPTPTQQLIQGVAVKLGTEGPTGPNQRVIMRAKLVTKPPSFNRAMTSTQESSLGIRRSVLAHQHQRSTNMVMMEQKPSYSSSVGTSSSTSSGTYPPVGTVQPTARARPNPPSGSQSKSDAMTATVECEELKSIVVTAEPQLETSLKQPCALIAAKSTRLQHKQGSVVKEKKSSADKELPSSSSFSAVITPNKLSAAKPGAKERRSSLDQSFPSTSTKTSTGVGKRGPQKGKHSRASEMSYVCVPSNATTFPSLSSPAQLVEAPTFHPTEKEFQDPLEFIDKIRPIAEKFGLCRVVPPPNFKPECKVTDDMRFTAYNQYVHKMLHRFGPNVKEMMAIRKYLATQSILLTHPPWIGGMEIDLPRLYQTVQSFGGLKEVIEKKRWQRVADGMKIPKSAQDRFTKLDDIYCKYLLPYDTLSPDERQKLFDEVEKDWAHRESRVLSSRDSATSSETPDEESDGDLGDESEECIVKGRNMPLNAFYRIARNTMSMWFRQPEPPAFEVEQEFWRHVMSRQSHVCVHSGSIDSSGWGYGFPCSKNSPFARHPWNLKVLTNNSGSVLRSIGPIMGVTVPTLHVGMLFTTCCWYRDPHGLPWIEYLHTGANKIWYGIPDTYSAVFRSALTKLVPRYCKNKTIWLPSDTAMVPPPLLVKHGVSLCHTVQEPGQFIVVFPRAFTSSICTGYLVSESVYFAQPRWLGTAEQVFKDIQGSCEPSMFSLERLLFSIATDTRSHVEVLRQVLPIILRIRLQELDYRKQLYNLGLKTSERLPLPEANVKRRKSRPAREEEGDYECEMCRANLFVSLVTNSHEEGVYCLPHAIALLTKKRHHLKYCKLMYTYDQAELNELIQKLQDRIQVKSQKKSQGKHSASSQK